MKLYELTETYGALLSLDIEESDLTAALEELQGTVAEKAEGIAMVMRTLEAEQNAYKIEIDRLKSLSDQAKKKSDSMKDYLAYNLQQMNIDKLDAGLFKFSFRKSESVVIDNQELIPKEFIKEKVTYSPDKTALKKALKDGVVDGCHIESKKNLQVK